jgi:hypothetical protein
MLILIFLFRFVFTLSLFTLLLRFVSPSRFSVDFRFYYPRPSLVSLTRALLSFVELSWFRARWVEGCFEWGHTREGDGERTKAKLKEETFRAYLSSAGGPMLSVEGS